MIKYTSDIYKQFLNSKLSRQWQKIGIKRRAGVLVPLFCIYSEDSVGIGEIPDICLIVEWCKEVGFTFIQLLPLNDTGFNFTPYDCQTTFGLDPMYLSLEKIEGVEIADFVSDIENLRVKFSFPRKNVDYGIKQEKLKILWKMYQSIKEIPIQLEEYEEKNRHWVKDYAIFKVLKEKYREKSWEEWEEKFKFREKDVLDEFYNKEKERINFYIWLQWQLYLQMRVVREYAEIKGVLIMGDLPFLVSRDSADVWTHQNYFKLNLVAGAPPDMYFAKGQRWGMPPYNWKVIEENNFDYIKQKVKYAENFYHMYRIDHFVGLFRIWTIDINEPKETYGLNGRFDPTDEKKWKEHGEKILINMTEDADMLPCAEDLGIIPKCSYEVLEEFGIPGIDVQRWKRDWGKTYEFIEPQEYRINSIATISTHDMSPFILWWKEEVGTVDKYLVKKWCEEYNFNYDFIVDSLFAVTKSTEKRLRWKKRIDSPEKVLEILNMPRDKAWMFYDAYLESYSEREKFWKYLKFLGEPSEDVTKQLIYQSLLLCSAARSIFCVHLIQDLLSLGGYYNINKDENIRINVPGTVSKKNWTAVLPL
ncbi:MAG: 4-alpha-glucanotransferase, partial [Candidatus Goldbacteria bacterium]|nr:4-alpha-glucanotransferase [Candidatus Goldiibacteriota bacterium]